MFNSVNMKSNDTFQASAHVAPKITPEKPETKNDEPEDYTIEDEVSDERNEKQNDRNYNDEQENWSLASSAISRISKSRVTVPVAPKLTCLDRLEKRKEFYTKLEEKHKALEKEKLEYEARTKEDEQEAIKQLRKSMVVKANPIPSFYREGTSQKAEHRKLPVTRAKSPSTRQSVGGNYKEVHDMTSKKSKDRIREGKKKVKSISFAYSDSL